MEQSPKQHLSNAIDHGQEYLETQKEIARLVIAKHSGAVAGYLVALLFITLFVMVFYILGNIAIVFFINKQIHDFGYSFLVVAGANMVLALLLMAMRKTIVKPVQNSIIKLITE